MLFMLMYVDVFIFYFGIVGLMIWWIGKYVYLCKLGI